MVKKQSSKKTKAETKPELKRKFSISNLASGTKKRYKSFIDRREHRSFRMSRRRDYVRDLQLPGYWSFTFEVSRIIKQNIRVFSVLFLAYSAVTALVIGITSQETYSSLIDAMRETSAEIFTEGISKLGEAGVLFVTAITGGIGQNLNEAQQTYSILLGLLLWLTTVGILRVSMAGKKPILRDVLYTSGSPIVATFIVAIVIVVQLLPLAIALLGYAAATTSGLIAGGGVAAMLFWFAAGMLALISLYWIVSSLLALVIVTLPGMYPFHALSAAGDLVYGRRLRLLLRIVWMALIVVVVWAIVFILMIILDLAIKELIPAIDWLPIIPVTLLLMSSASVIWTASYVYLLYRKVVDNDTAS
jgi:hypothetical protein